MCRRKATEFFNEMIKDLDVAFVNINETSLEQAFSKIIRQGKEPLQVNRSSLINLTDCNKKGGTAAIDLAVAMKTTHESINRDQSLLIHNDIDV